jgi:hypothetical protein
MFTVTEGVIVGAPENIPHVPSWDTFKLYVTTSSAATSPIAMSTLIANPFTVAVSGSMATTQTPSNTFEAHEPTFFKRHMTTMYTPSQQKERT